MWHSILNGFELSLAKLQIIFSVLLVGSTVCEAVPLQLEAAAYETLTSCTSVGACKQALRTASILSSQTQTEAGEALRRAESEADAAARTKRAIDIARDQLGKAKQSENKLDRKLQLLQQRLARRQKRELQAIESARQARARAKATVQEQEIMDLLYACHASTESCVWQICTEVLQDCFYWTWALPVYRFYVFLLVVISLASITLPKEAQTGAFLLLICLLIASLSRTVATLSYGLLCSAQGGDSLDVCCISTGLHSLSTLFVAFFITGVLWQAYEGLQLLVGSGLGLLFGWLALNAEHWPEEDVAACRGLCVAVGFILAVFRGQGTLAFAFSAAMGLLCAASVCLLMAMLFGSPVASLCLGKILLVILPGSDCTDKYSELGSARATGRIVWLVLLLPGICRLLLRENDSNSIARKFATWPIVRAYVPADWGSNGFFVSKEEEADKHDAAIVLHEGVGLLVDYTHTLQALRRSIQSAVPENGGSQIEVHTSEPSIRQHSAAVHAADQAVAARADAGEVIGTSLDTEETDEVNRAIPPELSRTSSKRKRPPPTLRRISMDFGSTLSDKQARAHEMWTKIRDFVLPPPTEPILDTLRTSEHEHHTDARVTALQKKLADKFDAVCRERLVSNLDPNEIIIPNSLQRFFGNERKINKPVWFTADFVFNCLHYTALFTGLYGLSWTCVAIYYREVPQGLLWMPLKLLKLGYPMVPVILCCWVARNSHDENNKWRRMTPGYYFANVKMSLMVSLGPGIMLGAVGKVVVLKLCRVEAMLGKTYSEFLLPFAWLLGIILWYFARHRFYDAFGNQIERQERCREDWGLYARWVLDPDETKPWQEWIRPGPHWILAVIPAPRFGTFHKIGLADSLRSVGITICCALMWFLLMLLGLIFPSLLEFFNHEDHNESVLAMMIHTDCPNLITNTLTAPWLIHIMWRVEPGAKHFFHVVMHAVVMKKHVVEGVAETFSIQFRMGCPWVINDDIDEEKEELFRELVKTMILAGIDCDDDGDVLPSNSHSWSIK